LLIRKQSKVEDEDPTIVKLRPTTPMKKLPMTPGKNQGPFDITMTTDMASQRH